jgi:hypothetical protein
MIQDNTRVCAALEGVDWVGQVGRRPRITRGWPKTLEVLPTVSVMEASNTHARYHDDEASIDAVETDIRIFGAETAIVDEITGIADTVMEKQLGYRRILCYEDGGAQAKDTRMKLMRYRRFFPAE